MSTPQESPAATFDFEARWRLHPQVSLRPEAFGALLYHFGTRRLSFLKDLAMTELVAALDGQRTARAAYDAAGLVGPVPPEISHALATLAEKQMISRVEGP